MLLLIFIFRIHCSNVYIRQKHGYKYIAVKDSEIYLSTKNNAQEFQIVDGLDQIGEVFLKIKDTEDYFGFNSSNTKVVIGPSNRTPRPVYLIYSNKGVRIQHKNKCVQVNEKDYNELAKEAYTTKEPSTHSIKMEYCGSNGNQYFELINEDEFNENKRNMDLPIELRPIHHDRLIHRIDSNTYNSKPYDYNHDFHYW